MGRIFAKSAESYFTLVSGVFMKVLVAPMAAMAETGGPFGRARALAKELLRRGHAVALCAAEEINYRKVEGVPNYPAPIPSPMGLPEFLGKRMLGFAQATGMQSRRPVRSFEEVLFIAGATNETLFRADIHCLLNAIKQFKPDVVFAEFRPAAIAAARLSGVRCATGFSYPVQKSHAMSPNYSKGAVRCLKELGLPVPESILDLFLWADLRIVPSSPALEPMAYPNTVFTGPFTAATATHPAWEGSRKNVVVYMGTGTVTARRLAGLLTKAFTGTEFEVYLATRQLPQADRGNLHIRDRLDFSALLPDAAVYLNHGGQNSIMDGLAYGVPQIVVPGKVFERQYNAASIAELEAGVFLGEKQFKAKNLLAITRKLGGMQVCFDNAWRAGRELCALGGVGKAAEEVERLGLLPKSVYK